MTFDGGFAEANVAKPGAIAEHVFAVVCLCLFAPVFGRDFIVYNISIGDS